jgi:hypothetical protein
VSKEAHLKDFRPEARHVRHFAREYNYTHDCFVGLFAVTGVTPANETVCDRKSGLFRKMRLRKLIQVASERAKK